MMQPFHIPIMEAVTRTHTWTEIHRTLHQKNNFYCVPVIHSSPLCSTFILRCLLQNTRTRPFTYLSFASRHSLELGQQGALERRQEETGLPSCLRYACSAGSGSRKAALAPSAWLAFPVCGACCASRFSSTRSLHHPRLLHDPVPAVRGLLQSISSVARGGQHSPGHQCLLVTTPWVLL